MKILDAMWFSSCGIVRVQTEYDGIKYYIKGTHGFGVETTEEDDSTMIAQWGSTFPSDAGDVLFGIKK